MVLIKSCAEWQNHGSFCAAVVVSLAHEDKSESETEEGKQTITQRTSQKTKRASETTQAFRGNEARDTSGATWFGWSVAQTAGVFFTRDPGAAVYHVS